MHRASKRCSILKTSIAFLHHNCPIEDNCSEFLNIDDNQEPVEKNMIVVGFENEKLIIPADRFPNVTRACHYALDAHNFIYVENYTWP
jgi:hypothetical protein